tara:strand:+ start:381 stop:941 length:561 start_codon:yes stop_codon:yes gene_type:complete
MIIIDASHLELNQHRQLHHNDLVVIDNLFSRGFIEYVHDHTIHAPAWLFGRTSSDGTNEIPAFSQQIFPPNAINASNSCFDIMYRTLSETLPPHELGEIVVNGQQHFHNTDFHTDCPGDEGLTFIYFVNKDYKPEWGGHTEVGDETVEFKPGRVALFKGNIPHKGNSFNSCYSGLRATIAIKVGLK